MASPDFPLSVVYNPLVYSPYSQGFKNDFRPHGGIILTEDGHVLDTEGNQPLLVE